MILTIIEARNLISNSSDGSDPFVKITVANLTSQVTDMKSNANTVVFNQSFTFKDLKLNKIEFENQEILIQVFDQNPFKQNELVGQQSIGISTLYKSNNHEFFKVWLPLINPQYGIQSRGALLISCYIIGVSDRPPVHDINEYNENNDVFFFNNIPDEQLTNEQLQLKQNLKKGVVSLPKPEIINDKLQFLVSIVRGEDFPILQYSSYLFLVEQEVMYQQLKQQRILKSQAIKPEWFSLFIFQFLMIELL
ncbi:hypothetical protein IMG5_161100 [Ichthyophthirius multifiliis]|uniref:C2 domain-containing protein n=1 Tax=Ichthyophthirius multifiliis TaxID=5932 RepID=G0R011_ICHMU|nr:hypothetical protein IMG5_161100 [Ichthyophthirius multifiliis]EGR29194.1 hypothetical protein IMG5_161100 [Ichthyophthirius multifiliis]|eukprot:XP_004030430.1 hypothetical protein IMG5_161100 [Ichthyophthirius multifiliis]